MNHASDVTIRIEMPILLRISRTKTKNYCIVVVYFSILQPQLEAFIFFDGFYETSLSSLLGQVYLDLW